MFFRDKDDDKNKKDPDSEKLWQELKGAEFDWCCKVQMELSSMERYILLAVHDGSVARIKVNFCPRCGRKLQT